MSLKPFSQMHEHTVYRHCMRMHVFLCAYHRVCAKSVGTMIMRGDIEQKLEKCVHSFVCSVSWHKVLNCVTFTTYFSSRHVISNHNNDIYRFSQNSQISHSTVDLNIKLEDDF